MAHEKSKKLRRYLLMFNTNSDYAINKLDPDAIVCRSVSGEVVRITREDFASDEEFEIWKS